MELDGNTLRIRASYHNEGGGWSDAEAALAQAQSALRQYGIKESDITLMERRGLDRVPVSIDEVRGRPGDYTIQVKYDHQISVDDIGGLETDFKVKLNFFDRIPWFVWNRQGSVSRYIFDASSMLHKIFTRGAVVSADASARFEKHMLALASEFSDGLKALPDARKAKVEEYFREANANGIAYDRVDLRARGFTPEEMDVIRDWRKFWDAHYYLENLDLTRTLHAENFQYFKNQNAELVARPVQKNSKLGEIYDPGTDTIVTHSKAESDALYSAGGTYAQLRRPITINGVEVDHMIVRNSPTEYLRRIRDTDAILNYRPGYFQIQYEAPRFVDVAIRANNGNITGWKSVAVAGDSKEARRWAEQYARNSGLSVDDDMRIRGDDRALAKDTDSWWDVNSSSGRIAQPLS